MRKGFYLLILNLILSFSGQAQSIFVHLTDGSTHSYPLIDIKTVTLPDNVMSLNLITGDTISWNFSVIRYYEYYQPPMSVSELGPLVEQGIQLYPNPSTGAFSIAYELTSNERVSIDLYDMKGSRVESIMDQVQQSGPHRVERNTSSLPSGVYLCRLMAGKFVYNKLIIITN